MKTAEPRRSEAGEARPLTAARRFSALLCAWALLFLASPGVLVGDGSMVLAILGVAVWGAAVARPLGEHRRRGLVAEWLGNAVGGPLLMWWVVFVVPLGLVYIGAGWGLYFLVGGAVVRARGRLPLGVAVGLAWLGCETLRTVFPPPFGLGWMQLGHFAHHHLWLSGSARVFGLEGLTFVLAALGGVGSELILLRRVKRHSLAFGLGALLLGTVLAQASEPPAVVPGPRLLLVQPGIPQELKSYGDATRNLLASIEQTRLAIEDARAAGGPEVDLVAWGESMLYMLLFEPATEDAIRSGGSFPPWMEPISAQDLEEWKRWEDAWIRGRLLGALAPGTSFAAGAEVLDVVDETVRRKGAVVLYDAGGHRSRPAAKRYLVPGAETMMGLERFGWVRAIVRSYAPFVPDFVAADETTVLPLETRDGRRYRVAATVCFDNAFLGPYVEPAADGPLDFHLVASNEAWYRESCEMDQMVAFSRIIALATGRTIARATNSGVSVVIGPDGRELGRVRDGDRDRAVAGHLAVTLPVPAELAGGQDAASPPYTRTRLFWRVLALVLGLGTWLVPRCLGNFGERAG